MMTGTARKTSLESKHLRNCDYFVIIPSAFDIVGEVRYSCIGERAVDLNTEKFGQLMHLSVGEKK